MSARATSFALAAFAVLALAGSLVASDLAASKPGPKKKQHGVVRVAHTGQGSERISKLPISKREGGKERVVISMTPRQLPRLRRHDRLELSSEVQFTLNCPEPLERCVGPPYRYDPSIKTRLILADSARAKHGKSLGKPVRTSCRQRRPREHHCVVVVRNAGLRVSKLRRLPCKPGRCFVNLIVSSYNPSAGPKDVLLVGGNKPDGRIPQDRGRINAVVFRPARARYSRPMRTNRRVNKKLPLDFKRHVVYSQKLRGLQAGEQLTVDAKAITDRTGLPYSVRTSSQLVIADSRNGGEPGKLSRRIGERGEIDESNGFNCTRNKRTCTTRKVGVLRISRDARRNGKPQPLFVNLVMIVGAKRVESHPDDRYKVRRGGYLDVTRYRKPRR